MDQVRFASVVMKILKPFTGKNRTHSAAECLSMAFHALMELEEIGYINIAEIIDYDLVLGFFTKSHGYMSARVHENVDAVVVRFSQEAPGKYVQWEQHGLQPLALFPKTYDAAYMKRLGDAERAENE